MDKPKKYRKRPMVVEAIRWTGENWHEVCEFTNTPYFEVDEAGANITDGAVVLHQTNMFPRLNPPESGKRNWSMAAATIEGDKRVEIGDWIIKGVAGEFYPCKPEIFAATYEEVVYGDDPPKGTDRPPAGWVKQISDEVTVHSVTGATNQWESYGLLMVKRYGDRVLFKSIGVPEGGCCVPAPRGSVGLSVIPDLIQCLQRMVAE